MNKSWIHFPIIKKTFLSFSKTEAKLQLRSGWQVVLFFVLQMVFLIPLEVLFFFISQVLNIHPSTGSEISIPFETASRTISLVAALISSAFCTYYFTNSGLSSIGYGFNCKWLKELVFGVLIAFLMVTLIVIVQALVSATKFGYNKEFALMPSGRAVTSLIGVTTFILIAASLEELMFRGFPLQTVARNNSSIFATLVMSVPFGLIHVGNPCHTVIANLNTVLAGIWLSAAYFKSRNLWFPTGLHFGWNFSLGLVYGLNVSGLDLFSKYSLVSSTDFGPTWLTGGCYGPEGGVSSTIVMLLCTLWFIIKNRNKTSLDRKV